MSSKGEEHVVGQRAVVKFHDRAALAVNEDTSLNVITLLVEPRSEQVQDIALGAVIDRLAGFLVPTAHRGGLCPMRR